MSWLKRFTSSKSFWVTLKKEWLADLGLPGLDPRNTNSSQVDSIFKNCPNPFWKNVYTGFRICVENYLRMFPEEFIYSSLYNHEEITSDLKPVLQFWCKNLMIVDIINDKMEFRRKEEITLACRKIQDYELRSVIKK